MSTNDSNLVPFQQKKLILNQLALSTNHVPLLLVNWRQHHYSNYEILLRKLKSKKSKKKQNQNKQQNKKRKIHPVLINLKYFDHKIR